MSIPKMIAPAVKNVPWQERPADLKGAPVWRYTENPIIGRNPVENVARIFNSAVMPYGDEFIGVFRGEQTNGIPYIYMGRSKDAVHWDIEKEKINLLTRRELEVLKLLSVGLYNKEIGKKLDISERTVKNHISSIFKKIDVTDRTQAAVFSIRNKLINIF